MATPGDYYNEIASSIPNHTKCVDDALLLSDTIEENFIQACNWLDLCDTNGITLNPDKLDMPKTRLNSLDLKSRQTL